MTTAEELSAAIRQVAAHETHIATLTARINEMRDHLEQAGAHLHAAETQLRAGTNASGHVKLTLGKEMMPDSFNGTDRVKFSDCEFKMSNFRSAGDYEHARDILEWITQQESDVPEDKFDGIALQRGWVEQARDHTRFARYLLNVLSNRTDGTPRRLVRNGRHKDGVNAWRETAAYGVMRQ